MTIKAENASSNIFKAVSYRVFMSPANDKLALCQAEWNIRKRQPDSLAKVSNNELWTFSISEEKQAPVPDPSFNLKETSTGIFLASSLSSSGTSIPPPYSPFTDSIKLLVYSHLISANSFVPFGSAAIASNSGKLLHIEPSWTPQGDLILKIFHQLTNLFNPKDLNFMNSGLTPLKTFISPPAISATVISNASPPDDLDKFLQVLELSTSSGPELLQQISQSSQWVKLRLESSGIMGNNGSASGVGNNGGGNIGTAPSSVDNVLIWPLALCYCQPPSQRRDIRDIDWFNMPDVFQQVDVEFQTFRTFLKSKKMLQQNQHQQSRPGGKLGGNINLLNDSNSKSFDTGDQAHSVNRVVSNEQDHGESRPIASNLLAGVNSTVYPTPPDPQVKLRTEGDTVDSSSWATPGGMGVEGWGDLDEELFGDGQEVTDADFNFFDQPEYDDQIKEFEDEKPELQQPERQQPERRHSEHSDDMDIVFDESPTVYPAFEDVQQATSQKAVTGTETSNQTLTKRTTLNLASLTVEDRAKVDKRNSVSLFAPLAFDPKIASDIDSKYSKGGRFFCPDSDSEDDIIQTVVGESQDLLKAQLQNVEVRNSPIDATAGIDIDSDNNFDQLNGIMRLDDGAGTGSVSSAEIVHTNGSNAPEPESSKLWTSVLSVRCPITKNSLDTIIESYDNEGEFPEFENAIRILIEQVVWDDGLLSYLIPSPLPVEPPTSALIRRTSKLFPSLTQMSLLDIIQLSDPPTNSAPKFDQTAPFSALSDAIGVTTTSLPGTTSSTLPSYSNTAIPSNNSNDPLSVPGSTMNNSLSSSGSSGGAASGTSKLPFTLKPSSLFPSEKSSPGPTVLQSGLNEPNSIDVASSAASNQIEAIEPQNPPPTSTTVTESTFSTRFIDTDIFHIQAPLFSFKRMQQPLTARAPILRFWKVFGLAPKQGPKDITLFLLHPTGEGISTAATEFLSYLRSTYEGSGLGAVEFGSFGSNKNGLIPFSFEGSRVEDALTEIQDAIVHLGKEMNTSVKGKSVFVLIVNPFSHLSSLLFVSRGFLGLRNFLRGDSISPIDGIAINLQIVPIQFLFVKDTLAVPSQARMTRFALNLYDKVSSGPSAFGASFVGVTSPPIEDTTGSIKASLQRQAPAFTLARIPPPRIQFKLTTTPSASLLDEDSFIHVAYASSRDRKWITAAWSDQWGEVSKVEAFSLIRKGARPRGVEDVCAEIWEKTVAIAATVPVQWRVAFAKLGTMEEDELSMWQRISGSSSKGISSVYFLSVDNNPTLVVSPNGNELFPYDNINRKRRRVGVNKYRVKGAGGLGLEVNSIGTGPSAATPVTPQRGNDVDSPDLYNTNMSTPLNSSVTDAERNDIDDVTIIDIRNDCYGVILQNQVCPSPTPGIVRSKPLITGYLLSPGLSSSSGEEGNRPRLFEAILIHSPTPHRPSIRSLLVLYSKLGSLGASSGVNSPDNSIVPWHVEAVDKMLKILIHV